MQEKNDAKNYIEIFKKFKNLRINDNDSDIIRLFIIMLIIFALMTLLNPGRFFTSDNFSSMAFQFPELGILSIAMMLAMLTGGIDLSIVGIANLSGILSALILIHIHPDWAYKKILLFMLVAIAIGILTGILCGFLNGILISLIGIPPILATLGSMQLFTGIATIITKGHSVFNFPEQFLYIGNGALWFLPLPFVIFVIVAIVFNILLQKTSFGLKLYMMGTNPIASRFSGINNIAMIIKTYLYSGLLAAIAGLIIIARTNSAKADYGTSYTLQAILVVVLGGVNYKGGFGKVSGIILAILILQFLSSGFNMLQFSNFFKDFIWGSVLILVMVLNNIINNKHNQKK